MFGDSENLIFVPFLDIGLQFKTLFLTAHVLALALGVGSATLLDLLLSRRVLFGSQIEDRDLTVIAFASKVVALGLLLCWLTGAAYLAFLIQEGSEILSNPKFHAKLAVLAILTSNGIFIHRWVLPHIAARVGQCLFAGTSKSEQALLLLSGALSMVSWYFPVLLGLASELNHDVAHQDLALFYGTVIGAVFTTICAARALVVFGQSRNLSLDLACGATAVRVGSFGAVRPGRASAV